MATTQATFCAPPVNSRTRPCVECERDFTYTTGRATDRKLCSPACRRLNKKKYMREWEANGPPCITPNCTRVAKHHKRTLCNTCFYRVRRTGTNLKPLPKPPRHRYTTPAGYVVLYLPSHPLAAHNGRVAEHRVVLHAHLGTGPHPCFWCGKMLAWKRITVDHLNEQKDDNRIENLVVSCNKCNRARGAMLPFVQSLSREAFDRLAAVMRCHAKA